ncbi:MAG: OmpA family protein [Candidatus Latescibacterota bacterium]
MWLLLWSVVGLPVAGQQTTEPPKRKFDPPRIVAVFRPPDTGMQGQQSSLFYINKGQESNLNRGEELNVYREVPVPGMERPLRIFIGTMTILESQSGSSVGGFRANPGLDQTVVRYKAAMKGDIVVPRLIIDSGVLFDPGKSELKSGVAQEFEKVATFVQNFSPNKLIIEGHTDADGDDASNQLLSDSRAGVVRQYLITAYNFITPAMIEARGYGERQPIVSNDTPENKALNRRIEVVVWE